MLSSRQIHNKILIAFFIGWFALMPTLGLHLISLVSNRDCLKGDLMMISTFFFFLLWFCSVSGPGLQSLLCTVVQNLQPLEDFTSLKLLYFTLETLQRNCLSYFKICFTVRGAVIMTFSVDSHSFAVGQACKEYLKF